MIGEQVEEPVASDRPEPEGATANRRWTAPFARFAIQLLTEAHTPARQAAAVGLGLYIGCTPFFGFHLLLSVALGWLFGLNRLIVYAASNISNPFVAPFLVATELQVGAWLRRGAWLMPSAIDGLRLSDVALDLLLGSVVVGGGLALAGAAASYAVVNRRRLNPAVASLIADTAARYLNIGLNSWQFAHGKLRLDPVYREVLRRDLLPARGTLADFGCGQGLMLALIATARARHGQQEWPAGWPTPPMNLRLFGIESRPRMADVARRSLGRDATIIEGDLRVMPLPRCSVALLFDVLHLMSEQDQDRLIARVAESIEPGGLLILREADAAAGWRFYAVRLGNWLCRAVQGRWDRRFHFRTAAEWQRRLVDEGFDVNVAPMGEGTPFANVVVAARRTTTITAKSAAPV